MKNRKKIIKDKKLRGEWAESVFMARAHEQGLPVSKPWGEMRSYDFVIGKTGRFVSVQVKSTISRLDTGYVCTTRGGHKAYPPGSFDFAAVYVIFEDMWYLIPAELIRGKRAIALYPKSPKSKYEPYREAWHLLREASAACEDTATSERSADAEPVTNPGSGAVARMENAMNYFKRYLAQGNVQPQKQNNDV